MLEINLPRGLLVMKRKLDRLLREKKNGKQAKLSTKTENLKKRKGASLDHAPKLDTLHLKRGRCDISESTQTCENHIETDPIPVETLQWLEKNTGPLDFDLLHSSEFHGWCVSLGMHLLETSWEALANQLPTAKSMSCEAT